MRSSRCSDSRPLFMHSLLMLHDAAANSGVNNLLRPWAAMSAHHRYICLEMGASCDQLTLHGPEGLSCHPTEQLKRPCSRAPAGAIWGSDFTSVMSQQLVACCQQQLSLCSLYLLGFPQVGGERSAACMQGTLHLHVGTWLDRPPGASRRTPPVRSTKDRRAFVRRLSVMASSVEARNELFKPSLFGDAKVVSAEEFKQHHSKVWSERANQYAAHTHEGSGIMMPLVRHIAGIVQTSLQGRDTCTLLDVASGSGEPALSIARSLPACEVVSTDFAPGMVEQAKRRAQGVPNFRAEVADAEDLSAFADASLDAVTCCAGMMLFPDHRRALREWHRVLKPGGQLVAAVWAPPGEQTQMVGLMRGLAMKLNTGVQGKASPGDGLGDAKALAKDVTNAGFSKVETSEFNVPMVVTGDDLQPAMLENPVIGELLDQARQKGRTNITQEALAAVREVASERGLLRPDGGVSCPTNLAIVITATA